ncbi:MAG: prepilin-type N-terminal cleavage/methylation domain-containing protein [Patescibacteria group bacterium]
MDKTKGFTLIELMVVVTIIAILSGVVMSNFGSSRAKARDTKRVSDIASLQLAAAQYFEKCDNYPTKMSSLSTPSCTLNPGTSEQQIVNLGLFMSRVPTDTDNTPYKYAYMKDSSGKIVDYHISATLEVPTSTALNDDTDFSSNSVSGWYTQVTGTEAACGASNCIDGTLPTVYDMKP